MLDNCIGRIHDLLNDRTALPVDMIGRLLHSGHDYWFSSDEATPLGLLGRVGCRAVTRVFSAQAP